MPLATLSDGQLGRQLSEQLGDDMVDMLRRTSEYDAWPRLIAYKDKLLPPVLAHRGEFLSAQRASRVSDSPEFLPMLAGGGFASLSDLISEFTAGGKGQTSLMMGKIGSSTGTANIAESLWNAAGLPGAGANPAAVAAGTIPTNATAGSLQQADPTGGDTLHLLSAVGWSTQAPMVFILYDRLWHGQLAMSSVASQTVTFTPTRYASTASPGNVAWVEARTALAATAHNTTLTYTNQAGTASRSSGAVAGVSGCAAGRIDYNGVGQWAYPMQSGDVGIQTITAWQSSASVTTGQQDLVLGHPLAFIPIINNGQAGVLDGINTSFNMIQILTGACLAMLFVKGTSATLPVLNAQFVFGSG